MQMSRKRKAENQDHGPIKKKITENKASPASKQGRKKKKIIFKVVSKKSSNPTRVQKDNLLLDKQSDIVASAAKKKRPFFKKEQKVTKTQNVQKHLKEGPQSGVTKSPDGKKVRKKKKFKKVKSFQERKTKQKKKSVPPVQKKPEKVKLPRKPEEISSNWKQLQQIIQVTKHKSPKQERRTEGGTEKEKYNTSTPEIWFDDGDDPLINALKKSKEQVEKSKTPSSIEKTDTKREKTNSLVKQDTFSGLTKAVGMDCEMVGVGDGDDSVLARVSLVNHYGQPLYDKFVKPKEKVTDYRTFVSGVRPKDLKNAEQFSTVQKEVSDIIKGRLLVGHALNNDLKVLFLSHPKKKIRDTSRYRPFRHLSGGRTPGLKKLTQNILGVTVQQGEHSSVEDAQAAMRLYTMYRKEWEHAVKNKHVRRPPHKGKQGKTTNPSSTGQTEKSTT